MNHLLSCRRISYHREGSFDHLQEDYTHSNSTASVSIGTGMYRSLTLAPAKLEAHQERLAWSRRDAAENAESFILGCGYALRVSFVTRTGRQDLTFGSNKLLGIIYYSNDLGKQLVSVRDLSKSEFQYELNSFLSLAHHIIESRRPICSMRIGTRLSAHVCVPKSYNTHMHMNDRAQ